MRTLYLLVLLPTLAIGEPSTFGEAKGSLVEMYEEYPVALSCTFWFDRHAIRSTHCGPTLYREHEHYQVDDEEHERAAEAETTQGDQNQSMTLTDR